MRSVPILALALGVLVVACGGHDAPSDPPADSSPTAIQADAATSAPPSGHDGVKRLAQAPAGSMPVAPAIAAPAPATHEQLLSVATPKDGPPQNPMKGWKGSQGAAQEGSTVLHAYIPWSILEPEDGKLASKQELETYLNLGDKPGSEKRHLIIRAHLQYTGMGEQIAARRLPEWVRAKTGWVLKGRNRAGEERLMLDYNRPEVLEKMKTLIATMGKHWDLDPRVYAVQLGMLGYWGEWHTSNWFDATTGAEYKLAESTKVEVLKAFQKAFPNKMLMGRYPENFASLKNTACPSGSTGPLSSTTPDACGSQLLSRLGAHNDSFLMDTELLPEPRRRSSFDEAVVGDKTHLKGPIGGEPRPEADYPSQAPTTDNVSKWEASLIGRNFYTEPGFAAAMAYVTAVGYSTMSDGGYSHLKVKADYGRVGKPFDEKAAKDKYLQVHKLFGYSFHLTRVSMSSVFAPGIKVRVEVEGKNIGVAPFYYPWNVELAVIDAKDNPLGIGKVDTDIRKIGPGQSFVFSSLIVLNDAKGALARGESLSVGLRISQPGATAINKPSRPANPEIATQPTPSTGYHEDWAGLDARNAYVVPVNLAGDVTVSNGFWALTAEKRRYLLNGWAKVKLPAVTPRALSPGLEGRYAIGHTFNWAPFGAPTLVTSTVCNWGTGSPMAGLPPDNFSTRWSGYLLAQEDGEHTFEVDSNDGSSLRVGNTVLVQEMMRNPIKKTVKVKLTAGSFYSLELSSIEVVGSAKLSLKWKRPSGTAFEAIPVKHLFHETPKSPSASLENIHSCPA